MNSIVISGITEQIDQNQLYQLVELVGPIESIQYSEDNKHLQINYKSNESVDKALIILQNIQINSVPLTIKQGTIETLNKENKTEIKEEEQKEDEINEEENKEIKEEEKQKNINWDTVRGYADKILSIPGEIDEKTHFSEYCTLGLTMAVSKCQEIDRNYQITQKIDNCFDFLVSKMDNVIDSIKNSVSNSLQKENNENDEIKENENQQIEEETNEVKEY